MCAVRPVKNLFVSYQNAETLDDVSILNQKKKRLFDKSICAQSNLKKNKNSFWNFVGLDKHKSALFRDGEREREREGHWWPRNELFLILFLFPSLSLSLCSFYIIITIFFFLFFFFFFSRSFFRNRLSSQPPSKLFDRNFVVRSNEKKNWGDRVEIIPPRSRSTNLFVSKKTNWKSSVDGSGWHQ